MKYVYILLFLLTRNTASLKAHWQQEVVGEKKFSWRRILRKCREPLAINHRYWFWWRLANEMYLSGNKKFKRAALLIQERLTKKYNVDIMLGAKIGKCPTISHFSGVVITAFVDIGDFFTIKQNSTIGVKTLVESHGSYLNYYCIKIGHHVSVGASSCIIADNITIGDNVNIGAMTFVNKDIPGNSTVFTKKLNETIIKQK